MSARLRRLLSIAVAAVIISVYLQHRHANANANANASLGSLGLESYGGGHDYHRGPYRDMLQKERRRGHAHNSGKDPSSPMAINDLTEPEVLQRSPGRRPGYAANSNSTYFGYVMRDLAARLLTRHGSIAEGYEDESNVLVVSKDLGQSSSLSQLDELRTNASIGPSFVRYATDEGHRVHSIGSNRSADVMFSELTKWWEAQTSSGSGPPRSILLAVFDPPVGSEDVLATNIASTIISKVPVKYIVFRVSATIVRGATARGNVAVINGLESIMALSQMDYKVSLLSSSHSLKLYSPNALVGRDRDGANAFLRRGAERAALGDGTFTAYLFATRGLDLAIPSAREYFATLGTGAGINKDTGDCHLFMKSCKTAARLEFTSEADKRRAVRPSQINKKGLTVSATEFLNSINVYCGNATISDPERLDRFWISGPSVALSEAVCAHISLCGGRKGAAACATRIIPAMNVDVDGKRRRNIPNDDTLGSTNLMVLEIDTISRPLFAQVLPRTSTFLDSAGFVSFDQYTPVALEREANHAALFAGQHMPSQNTRERQSPWIWDELNRQGYAIFKGRDACARENDLNPNLLANSTHGSALHEMNCFDFERPNCIAGKAAATRLVEHAAQFIDAEGRPWAALLSFSDTQEDTNVLSATLDDPLKSLLATWRDLNPSGFDNAFIVVVSHCGISHGSYLQTRQGRRERASPVLFMKPPLQRIGVEAGDALQANADLWTTPLDAYTTMRHILFEEGQGGSSDKKIDLRGASLLSSLPDERRKCHRSKIIPRYICNFLEEQNQGEAERAVGSFAMEMKSPASMLSYYADIPSSQKEKRLLCAEGNALSKSELYENSFAMPCKCSTSHRNWYSCSHHPWKGSGSAVEAPHEYFAFVDCPNRTLSFETRVERDPAILHRSKQHRSGKKHKTVQPNILFIEVDSASTAYADRHFPLTREFTKSHQIERNDLGELTCKSGFCAVDFSHFSVTGPNSISNQVSALGGCLTSHRDEECKDTTVDGLCNDPNAMEFNLYHHITFRNASVWCSSSSMTDRTTPSPFLFDIARNEGYVSLFGEEFCFNESPYVTQGNIFELNTDVEVHRAHCRLAERYLSKENIPTTPKMLWSGKSGFHLPCIDGDTGAEKNLIPLTSILEMWESYKDVPKFAFLNAMAAHDYAARWEAMPLNAELYDRRLLGFLKEMKARPDASNTVIILRSDHGLQDGPSTADFSSQVEHARPWTEIIVPESLSEISLEALKNNQERMASGFDIYRTLRDLMSTGSENAKLPAIPSWSINLLTTEIPEHRTCAEGKIPLELCRNENEKTYIAPSFGTCNKFDERLKFFCPKKGTGGRVRVRVVEYSAGEQRNKTPKQANKRGKATKKGIKRAKRARKRQQSTNAELTTKTGTAASQKLLHVEGLPEELIASWQSIDFTVATYPKASVSGGIFLYPRQQNIFFTIVQRLEKVLQVSYPDRPLRICETGFGAGHSASLFLAASRNAAVISFDKFNRPYQTPAADLLMNKYPDRFTSVAGDSCLTVPTTLSSKWDPAPFYITENGKQMTKKKIQCDMLHGSSLCLSDNIDLVENSPPGTLLTSTSMGSLEDEEVYFGPSAQWTKLRANGCIRDITCFAEEETEVDKKFVFSRRILDNKMAHQFCLAIVTGKCSVNDRKVDSPLSHITESLNLRDLYPQYQVKPPAQGVDAIVRANLATWAANQIQ